MKKQLDVWQKQREQEESDTNKLKDSKEDQKKDQSLVTEEQSVLRTMTTKNLKEINQEPKSFYCDTFLFKERNDDY
jgi:hypothetical protein